MTKPPTIVLPLLIAFAVFTIGATALILQEQQSRSRSELTSPDTIRAFEPAKSAEALATVHSAAIPHYDRTIVAEAHGGDREKFQEHPATIATAYGWFAYDRRGTTMSLIPPQEDIKTLPNRGENIYQRLREHTPENTRKRRNWAPTPRG